VCLKLSYCTQLLIEAVTKWYILSLSWLGMFLGQNSSNTMSWMLAKSPRLGKEFCYTGVGTPTVKRCYHPVILFFSFFLDRIVRSSSHFYIEKHSSMFSATASANLSCLSPLTAAVEFILLVYLPASKMVRFSSSVSHTHTKL